MFKMITGSQHTKASVDIRRRVFVKRLFGEAPLRCCEAFVMKISPDGDITDTYDDC